MNNMLGPPDASVALMNLGGNQHSPLKKKIFFSNYEDDLITAVVAVLLTGMFLAYLCLCCHVWGLHMRLFQLIKSLRSSDDANQNNENRAQDGQPSISVPLAGRSLEDYLTPPPRYSLVNDSLPTYSCALFRMLGLLKGPVRLRILVYVDPDNRNSSAFSDNTPLSSRTDTAFRDENIFTISSESSPRLTVSKEVLLTAVASGSSSPIAASPFSSVDSNNPQLSYTSDSLFSIPSETSSIEDAAEQSSSCELKSVISISTHSSAGKNIQLDSVPLDNSAEESTINNSASVSDVRNSVTIITSPCADQNNNNIIIRPNSDSVSSIPTTSAYRTSDNTVIAISSSIRGVSSESCKSICQENVQKNDKHNESSSSTLETSNMQVLPETSDPISHNENRSPNNSIKLLMKGIGGVEQVVYALKSTSNCYVANWPLPPRDALDSDSLEVLVDGQPVEDIYLEFLNGDGQRIGMTQLLPSPRSTAVPSRYSSSVHVSPFPSSSLPQPQLLPIPSPSPPLLSAPPPPYHP